ncbi:MAG: hypothetical protein IJH40_02250 [Ruminococcus sp.]|uniref:ATP-grasp domain-containing protein n=1 Tax=Ruminococcus sp. TaxID=41978 RepID=UPI00287302B9|nr:hypothetical protein [Ruminococcus sp.]MBQ3284440.1 hypothetical protein [Ruminococcus sp.]
MTGWIVYDAKQYEKNRWFAHELLKNCSSFCDIRIIIAEKLRFGIFSDQPCMTFGGEPISRPDFVIMRAIFPLLSSFLETCGARVFNDSRTSRVCNDKRLTHLALARSGVPMMNTAFFDRAFFSPDSLNGLNFPVVVKSAAGHGGSEVFPADSVEELLEIVRALHDDRFLVQERFSPAGSDLRVYVLGGEVIGAALRRSDTLKSNLSLGGTATAHMLSSTERETIGKVLNALPFSPDFIGVDFLYADGKMIFNEIEDVVGTRMLYQTASVDAAMRYAAYIKNIMTE